MFNRTELNFYRQWHLLMGVFRSLEQEVKCNVSIENTGFLVFENGIYL